MAIPRLARLHANVAALMSSSKDKRRRLREEVFDLYRSIPLSARQEAEARKHLPPPPPPPDPLRSESMIFESSQNILFPKKVFTAEKLIVVIVPEHNNMSGGIFSLFSIANHLRRMQREHHHEVVVMTRPNPEETTYLRQTNFRNTENVFRFNQIMRCENLKELYILLPEYAGRSFAFNMTAEEREFLRGVPKISINLMNQNIDLMPEAKHFRELYAITTEITQSVAHHGYFNQEVADRYGVPTLLLPAFTDLSEYKATSFDAKEDLIIYSLDEAPHKQACLDKIASELPHYALVEIRDITFDDFMDLATRCRFSISFGEGFDGYVAQPIHQGGIGMTSYSHFFPDASFKDYVNIFSDQQVMVDTICDVIRSLESDKASYEALNAKLIQEYEKLYSEADYLERIRKLALKQFDLFPSPDAAGVVSREGLEHIVQENALLRLDLAEARKNTADKN